MNKIAFLNDGLRRTFARGKVVMTANRVIAKDGKSYTFTAKGKNAKGQRYHNVQVYDRQ